MTHSAETMTLGELVARQPASARVLESFGLDFCCHGEQSLADACAAAGIEPETVVQRLDALTDSGDLSWSELAPPQLADHIVGTHHRYLHQELPALDALAAKVLSVHGGNHPELAEVARLVRALRDDLEPHMAKEERVLFPAIHALAAGRREFPFGSIENPVRMMRFEHERTGELLAQLRDAARNYEPPEDACASYTSLYERLRELEIDTHLHIHKENHRLFPAAVAIAVRRSA